jgi:hypothetical protein
MEVKWYMWSFRKIPQTEVEIQRRGYIVPQVNFPSLLTDSEQTYTFLEHIHRMLNMKIQENPSNGRCDPAKKVLSSKSKAPFIIALSLPNTHV